jgi:tetratricopeptide (TPR) repeat protein
VNESPAIRDALQHVVLVRIDCEKGEGPELAKKYGVSGYPTYVVVDGAGEVTDATIGYTDAEAWAAFAVSTTEDRRTIADKTAAYQEAPTAPLAYSLGHHASTKYDFKGAVAYFRVARDLDPGRADVYTESILTNLYYGSYGGDFTVDEVEAEVKPAFAVADSAEKLNLAKMITVAAREAGQPARAAPYLEAAMAVELDPDDEDLARTRARLAIDAALIVDKDEARAVALMRESLPEGWQDDPRGLNRFAWWCFENEVNLDEALTLALRGVELAPDDESRAQILDTAAEICNALGDCSRAVAYIKQAIELEPNNEGHKLQLARFEKLLAEQTGG